MYVSPLAANKRSELDTVIFDMDGVLLDISKSIRAVNCLAVPYYLREVLGWGATDNLLTSEDIELFKHAGGFNDDWDLTYALVLFYLVKRHEWPEMDADTLNAAGPSLAKFARKTGLKGGGLIAAEEVMLEHIRLREKPFIDKDYQKPVIRQVFQELLAGDLCERMYGFEASLYLGRGHIYDDVCLIDQGKIPRDKKVGMQTGRTYEEAVIGLEFCKLTETIPDHLCVTKRNGFHKPEPGGLLLLAERLGSATGGIYIGDTLDDLRTVRNLNALGKCAPFMCALVLTGPAGARNQSTFMKEKPDVLATDVNEVLDWINQ